MDVQRLSVGRQARLEALAAYLAALPVETTNHWEFLRCIVLDLQAVKTCLNVIHGKDE